MLLDFSKKGKVRSTMTKHIQSILENSPVEMDCLAETPYVNHLLQV